jgi:hypothetical protein
MTETKRECGDCTACCEGWLSGVVNDREFYPGMPCHFKGCNGCSIYEDRPESPCKTYSCEWLKNNNVPEWMKPSKSGVIITGKDWTHPDGSKQVFLEILEMGKKIDSTVLNWLFRTYLRTQVPMKIQIGGGFNLYGNQAFLDVHTG